MVNISSILINIQPPMTRLSIIHDVVNQLVCIGNNLFQGTYSLIPYVILDADKHTIKNRHLIKLDKLLLPIILHLWHFSPHHRIFTIKFNCIWNYICRNKKVKRSKEHLLTRMTLSTFLTLSLRGVHFGPWLIDFFVLHDVLNLTDLAGNDLIRWKALKTTKILQKLNDTCH